MCIEAHVRAALERLRRCCTRPPFAMDRLRQDSRTAPHTTGADRAHCSAGATAAYAPAPLFWCAGSELSTQGCGGGAPWVAPQGNALPPTPEPAPPQRSKAHYLWAVLIARFLRTCGTDRPQLRAANQLCPQLIVSSITSGRTRSHHTYPRRAGHRCGMTATRRRMRGCTLSPIGIWQRKRHRTMRSISASTGDRAKR